MRGLLWRGLCLRTLSDPGPSVCVACPAFHRHMGVLRGEGGESEGAPLITQNVSKKRLMEKIGRLREASESSLAGICWCKQRRLLLTALWSLTLQKWRPAWDWVTSGKVQSRRNKLLASKWHMQMTFCGGTSNEVQLWNSLQDLFNFLKYVPLFKKSQLNIFRTSHLHLWHIRTHSADLC